jgi:hypothetical protein
LWLRGSHALLGGLGVYLVLVDETQVDECFGEE